MIGGIEETSASFEARSAPRSYPTKPHRPQAVRSCPRGHRRSVGRGSHRPAIEPRNRPFPGCRRRSLAEGNMVGRIIASAYPARRGRRPWHVRTLLTRESGDLMSDQWRLAVVGPHREGEEPKPVMHGHEKSDSAIVATKLPNKAGKPAAEAVERRAGTKGNTVSKARAELRSGKACPRRWSVCGNCKAKAALCSPQSTRGRSRMP